MPVLNEYKQTLNNLLQNVDKLKTILNENNATQTVDSMNKLEKKIKEEKFLVVSFGGFSSGKTTFLNALIGNRILPAKTLPTTATINYLLYNKKPYAEIQFKDEKLIKEDKKSGIEEFKRLDAKFKDLGKKTTINIEEIEEFVTDTKVSPYVKEVFLNYPSEVLQNGLIFVDTPGTDSIIKAHKRISYSFIEKADVILFFIWGPRPFTKSDFEFLSDIKSLREFIKEDKFFFILNAIDSIDEQPVDEVINYVREILVKKSGIKNPNIIPISSRLALYYKLFKNNIIDKDDKYLNKLLRFNTEDNKLDSLWKESNFENIEKKISNYLVEAKGEILIKKAKDIIFRIIDNLLNQIVIEEQTFKKSLDEVESEINGVLLPLLEEQRKEKDRLVNYAVANIAKIKKNIKYDEMKDNIKDLVEQKLDNLIDSYQYARELNYISMDLKKHIEDGLKDILTNVMNDMNEIINKIQTAINKNFDIPLEMSISITVDPDMDIDIPDVHEVSETINTGYGGGGSTDMGGILELGLLGGIVAALIPGGLGFFGGAILGAGAGFLMDQANHSSYGSTSSSTTTTSFSESIESIKKKVFGKIKYKMTNVKSEIEKKLDDTSKTMANSVSNTFDNILNNIEKELNTIKEKRREFNNKYHERKKIMDRWEKDLNQIKTDLNKLISN